MNFERLSRDILSEIFSMLDLESLEGLWASLNRSTQRVLSSSGVIPRLVLYSTVAARPGLRRYFLNSIRDVHHVCLRGSDKPTGSLGEIVSRSLAPPPPLVNLNPVILEISWDYSTHTPSRTRPKTISPKMLASLLPRLTTLQVDYIGVKSAVNSLCTIFDADPSMKSLNDALAMSWLAQRALEGELRQAPSQMDNQDSLQVTTPYKSRLEVFKCELEPFKWADLADLSFLPNTLKTLHLYIRAQDAVVCFSHLWRQFPALEEFYCGVFYSIGELFNDEKTTHETLAAPKSLTALAFPKLNSFPRGLLPSLETIFAGSSLKSLRFDFEASHPLSEPLPEYSIPTTIEAVTVSYTYQVLKQKDDLELFFWRSWHHLTSLSLLATHSPPGVEFSYAQLLLLADEQQLERFHLNAPTVNFCCIPICASHLPPKLTSLTLDLLLKPLPEDVIERLPTSLVLLTVSTLDLSTVPLLKKRLPSCRVVVSQPLCFWKSAVHDVLRSGEFEKFWVPAFDFNAWAPAVLAHYTALEVFFKLSYKGEAEGIEPIPGSELHVSTKHIIHNDYNLYSTRFFTPKTISYYSQLTKLELDLVPTRKPLSFKDHFPRSLTKLELHDTPISSMGDLASLTYLSSRAHFVFEHERSSTPLMPRITYLDVPHWTFGGNLLTNWKLHDMERLTMNVEDLADYNVVDFLTKSVNAKTRSNMRVYISYIPTGLLPALSVQSLKDVSVTSMEEATSQSLLELLARPMPPDGHAPASKFGFSTANTFGVPFSTLASSSLPTAELESIGKPVAALAMKPMTSPESLLFTIPKTATKVKLDYEDPRSFALISATSSRLEGPLLYNQYLSGDCPQDYSVFDSSYFSRTLVHLELVRVGVSGVGVASFWPFLPPSLLYLRLVVQRFKSIPASAALLPRKLTTLILEQSGKTRFSDVIPFSFSKLSPSIERIGINASELHLSDLDLATPPKLDHLTKLKTVFLGGATASTLVPLCEALPKEACIVSKHFIVQKFVPQNRKRTATKLDPTLVEAADSIPQLDDTIAKVTSEEVALRMYPQLRVEGKAPEDLQNRLVHDTLEAMIATDVIASKGTGFGFTSPAKPTSEVQSMTSAFASTNLNSTAPTSPVASFGSSAPSTGTSAPRRAVRPPRK